jgi:hypothetical protein
MFVAHPTRFCGYCVLGLLALMPQLALAQPPVRSFAELQSILRIGDEVQVTDSGGKTTEGRIAGASKNFLSVTVDRRSTAACPFLTTRTCFDTVLTLETDVPTWRARFNVPALRGRAVLRRAREIPHALGPGPAPRLPGLSAGTDDRILVSRSDRCGGGVRSDGDRSSGRIALLRFAARDRGTPVLSAQPASRLLAPLSTVHNL